MRLLIKDPMAGGVEEGRVQGKNEGQKLEQQTSKENFNTQRKDTSCKKTRIETDDITNGDETKSSAMERGEKIQRNMPCEDDKDSQEKTKESQSVVDTELGLDNSDGQISERIRLPESALDFKKVKSIKDFYIVVNGLVINSEFPKHIQIKYYELCCSQQAYLHDHLLDGIRLGLAVEVILETVEIADAIRARNLTTYVKKFSTWRMTLKFCQTLGMNVGFLRAKLYELIRFLYVEKRKLEEAKVRTPTAEEKIRDLERSFLDVKKENKRLEAEIKASDSLKSLTDEKREAMYRELAQAPW